MQVVLLVWLPEPMGLHAKPQNRSSRELHVLTLTAALEQAITKPAEQ